MSILKKILILMICSYFLNMFILANSNNDEDDIIWPKLFSEETWIVIIDETGRYELKSLIDDPEMINGNISTNEIKWWMMESFGLGYGKAKYDQEIANNLLKVLNQIAWKVQEKIDNCKILQNMYGDKIKKKKHLPISFQYYKNGACGDTMSRSVRMNNNMLRLILRDIGEQLKNGVKDVQANVSKYTCQGNDIVEIWGHETIHAITGSGEPSEADECFAHCLTKKCITENPDAYVLKEFRTNGGRNIRCNEITDKQWEYLIARTGGVDPRKEMKAGDCFCDEKWTKDAKCDENKPKPTSTSGSDKENHDQADDNYSFASATNYITNLLPTIIFDFPIEGKRNYISFNFYPDILIYEKYYGDIQNLLKKYDEDYLSDYIHDYFSNNHKILFIGSGELIGDEKSALIKQALESFVANGGVLLLETEQYGSQIEDLVPIPENESLKFIGFT